MRKSLRAPPRWERVAASGCFVWFEANAIVCTSGSAPLTDPRERPCRGSGRRRSSPPFVPSPTESRHSRPPRRGARIQPMSRPSANDKSRPRLRLLPYVEKHLQQPRPQPFGPEHWIHHLAALCFDHLCNPPYCGKLRPIRSPGVLESSSSPFDDPDRYRRRAPLG